MASPKICILKPARAASKGFTVLEMLVVMGLLAIVSALGLFMSMDSYRGGSFRNERDTIVTALQTARSQAMNNICLGSGCTDGKAHGVHFEIGKYIIFQGNAYSSSDPLNQTIASNDPNVVVTGPADVIFSQLSGQVAAAGTIAVSDQAGHSSTISINGEGQIVWTN